MKIVVLDGYTLNPGDLNWRGLEELGTLQVYDRTEASLILERAQGAALVLTNKTPLTAESLKQLKSLANDLGVTASIILKRRLGDRKTEVVAVSASVKGVPVIIYDDMIRTGGSLIAAAGHEEVCHG